MAAAHNQNCVVINDGVGFCKGDNGGIAKLLADRLLNQCVYTQSENDTRSSMCGPYPSVRPPDAVVVHQHNLFAQQRATETDQPTLTHTEISPPADQRISEKLVQGNCDNEAKRNQTKQKTAHALS